MELAPRPLHPRGVRRARTPILRGTSAVLAVAVLLLHGVVAAQPDTLGIQDVAYAAARLAKGSDTSPTAHLIPELVWGDDGQWRLQVGGFTRLRLMDRYNYGMNGTAPVRNSYGLLRSELGFDLTYCSVIRGYFEVIDSRSFGASTNVRQTDPTDINQLFFDLKPHRDSPWTLRLGRQEMKLANERLVNSSGWSNLPRTYEGLRAIYKTAETEWNLFATIPDTYDHDMNGTKVTGHKEPIWGRWFYGAYGEHKIPHEQNLDTYFLGWSDTNTHRTFPDTVQSEEGQYGTENRYTVGGRLYGPLWRDGDRGTLSYDAEGAYQFGNLANDTIRAWMLHGNMDYEWNVPWKPVLSLQGNLASGDRQYGDGQSNTFVPLYGEAHRDYGIIDFLRLENMREIALNGSVKPTDKLTLQLQLHQYWLDSATDAWYNSSGSDLGRDTTGNSGTHIGQELDLISTYAWSRWMTLEGGAAWFTAGRFANAVGRSEPAGLLYMQCKLSF